MQLVFVKLVAMYQPCVHSRRNPLLLPYLFNVSYFHDDVKAIIKFLMAHFSADFLTWNKTYDCR